MRVSRPLITCLALAVFTTVIACDTNAKMEQCKIVEIEQRSSSARMHSGDLEQRSSANAKRSSLHRAYAQTALAGWGADAPVGDDGARCFAPPRMHSGDLEPGEMEIVFGDIDIEGGEVEMVCGDAIVDVPWSQERPALHRRVASLTVGQFEKTLGIDPEKFLGNLEGFKQQFTCFRDERSNDRELLCFTPKNTEMMALKFQQATGNMPNEFGISSLQFDD